MPCFKGLAVSIHTPDGPLSEYSIQKQSRFSRISSYIPVPPPKIRPRQHDGTESAAEQSTFAVSITLLTPGQAVPYSTPKPSADNVHPAPRRVGSLPSSLGLLAANSVGERGRYMGTIAPYVPLTTSPHETVAAYIYFDGRPKEEVATLLRRGEETWVNSRWVSVAESEGGGLAEREFLFREVGLERWLNGLDLTGKGVDGANAAAKIERRRQRMERKSLRRKKRLRDRTSRFIDSDDEDENKSKEAKKEPGKPGRSVLRYGDASAGNPTEQVSDSDDMLLSGSEDSSSDDSDDDPVPESTGQIKIALYRVLASGEVRRGEYSPQFDAHDGDEEGEKMDGAADGGAGDASTGEKSKSGGSEELDHTTSFAKPKTLDPQSISTQTVTGIDPQDRPFAVFTFLYRGEKQLQKMGILPTAAKATSKTPAANGKRRSLQEDFSSLKPLNSNGLKNFSEMRDPQNQSSAADKRQGRDSKAAKKDHANAMDSDEDEADGANAMTGTADDDGAKGDSSQTKDGNVVLSPEDVKRQGELADGVQKIRLKRQHSAEQVPATDTSASHTASSASPPGLSPPPTSSTQTLSSTAAPHAPAASTDTSHSPGPLLPSVAFGGVSASSATGGPFKPTAQSSTSSRPSSSGTGASTSLDPSAIGSPLKKARGSLSSADEDLMRQRFGFGATSGPQQGASAAAAGFGNAQSTEGRPSSSAGPVNVSADVMGAIEHDRMNSRGSFATSATSADNAPFEPSSQSTAGATHTSAAGHPDNKPAQLGGMVEEEEEEL